MRSVPEEADQDARSAGRSYAMEQGYLVCDLFTGCVAPRVLCASL
jgi:hypothetical protein